LVKNLARRTTEAYEGLRLYFTVAQSFGYIAALKTVPQGLSHMMPQSVVALNSRAYTKSAILNALVQEEVVQDRMGRAEPRAGGSNGGMTSATATTSTFATGGLALDPHPEGDESKQDDDGDAAAAAAALAGAIAAMDEDEPAEMFSLDMPSPAATVIGDEDDSETGSAHLGSSPRKQETTGNPFDTGNSSLILLAEITATDAAGGGGSGFEAGISNPFLSGMSTFTSRPAVGNTNPRGSALRRSGSTQTRNTEATNRALDQCVRSFEFSGIMLRAEDVVVTKEVIGRGAFSVVYRGKLQHNGAEVAVKELQLEEWGRSPEMVLDFRAEVALMKAVHHPNVLQLIGAQTKPTLRLVSEFCARGNLLDLLYCDRQNHPANSKVLTWSLRVRLALGEARGMAFLHTAFPAPLIHRDLKSPNLLLSKQWTLKVSDFGLSRFMGRTGGTGPCGTTQWMAPEVMEGRPYDETADVFSFGVNLWELASRRIPWEGQDAVKAKVVAGQRLDVGKAALERDCPLALVALMQQCWDSDPKQRPKFPEIVKILKRVQRDMEV
jgi:hypothetical protein